MRKRRLRKRPVQKMKLFLLKKERGELRSPWKFRPRPNHRSQSGQCRRAHKIYAAGRVTPTGERAHCQPRFNSPSGFSKLGHKGGLDSPREYPSQFPFWEAHLTIWKHTLFGRTKHFKQEHAHTDTCTQTEGRKLTRSKWSSVWEQNRNETKGDC